MSGIAERKALILIAAAELMVRRGYEATTIAEVAKAAGVSVGSVMNLFGSKAHLALDVRDSVAANLAQAVSAPLEKHARHIPMAIEGAIAAYLMWRAGKPAHAVLLQELAAVRVDGRRTADAVLVRLSAVVTQWAIPQIAAGRLPTLDPAHLHALILGPAMTLAASCAGRLTDAARSELARHLTSHVCAGLWPASASAGSVTAKSQAKHVKGLKGAEGVPTASERQLHLMGV